MLLSLVVGLTLGLATVVVVLLSSVGAVVGTCRKEAQSAYQGVPVSSAAPGFAHGSPGESGSPSYVSQKWSQEALSDIPKDYLPIYEKAGKDYGLDAAILAAIGKIESDHGRASASGVASGENSAGAGGPMQFLASTWANVGVDGNGDGLKDRYDPEDAIPGAANYLKLSGAPEDYHSAILTYNHAEWYYQDVVSQADRYRASGEGDPQLALIQAPPLFSGFGLDLGRGPPLSGVASAAAGLPEGILSSLGPRAAMASKASGWDLVDENKHLDYEDHSSYHAEVQSAARAFNKVSAVEMAPSPSSSETDVRIGDSNLDPGVGGYTSTDGTMLLDNTKGDYPYGAVTHETGHAEGLGHVPTGSVTDTDPTTHYTAPTPSDVKVLHQLWGPDTGGGGGGGDVGGGSGDPFVSRDAGGLSGGRGEPKNVALFPLPDKYFDSYSDDWGARHEGTDLYARMGTPVTAVVGGKVVRPAGRSGGAGASGAVMVKAGYSVGTIHEGDILFYANLSGSSAGPGDTVQAGDKIGAVGAGGGEAGQKAHLHLGWYDPSGSREEAASGAMNPYPLLEWIVDSGGSATGTGLAPGVAAAQLPAYCAPLQILGLVSEVANPAGGPTISGTDPTSTSGGFPSSAPPGGGGSGSASGTGQLVVEEAKKYLGVPYVLGGLEVCDPGVRMDCTCLTRTVYAKFGYTLPDCPTCLWNYGEPVSGPPQAGDLLVWDDPGDGTGGHVAISMGNGQIIHANMGTMDVAITPMWDSPQYMGARRLIK